MAKNIYLKTPGVLKELKKIFGDEIFDNGLDLNFRSLANRVFSDEKELEKLNRLMFPLIRGETKKIINKNFNRDYIIIDAAVLFDCKLDLICDYIILVDTDDEKRKTFLKNKNLPDNDIKLKIEGQHIEINMKKVDFIISNSSSKKSLLKKVKDVLKNI